MRTHFTRTSLSILIFALLLSACASDPAPAADGNDPAAINAGPESVESIPESTQEEAAAPQYEPCNMLTQAEIQAAAFRDFPVGDGQSGTDTPFTRGEALSCAWELGDPEARFHERLLLYIITLNGQDPNAAYEENASRLARSEELTGVGDRATFEERSGFIVVLDGDFLFLLRADLINADNVEASLSDFAQLIISRK